MKYQIFVILALLAFSGAPVFGDGGLTHGDACGFFNQKCNGAKGLICSVGGTCSCLPLFRWEGGPFGIVAALGGGRCVDVLTSGSEGNAGMMYSTTQVISFTIFANLMLRALM